MPEWLQGLLVIAGCVSSVAAVIFFWEHFAPMKSRAERDAAFALMTDDEQAAEMSRNAF